MNDESHAIEASGAANVRPRAEETADADPRIAIIKELSTSELASLFIGIHEMNPSGDKDWKHLIREELKTRKE